jgi:hypothetical protein
LCRIQVTHRTHRLDDGHVRDLSGVLGRGSAHDGCHGPDRRLFTGWR